jgi:hypothetical protein
MIDASLQTDLLTTVSALPPTKQNAVLQFAKSLTSSTTTTLPPGTSGSELIQFMGRWSAAEADLIQKAVEEDFERIDPREW